MNSADLKLKIFRQIDSLEKTRLVGLYGVLSNYINSQKDMDDWAGLSDKQSSGIIEAIAEADSDKIVSHKKVIQKYRKKYSHA